MVDDTERKSCAKTREREVKLNELLAWEAKRRRQRHHHRIVYRLATTSCEAATLNLPSRIFDYHRLVYHDERDKSATWDSGCSP